MSPSALFARTSLVVAAVVLAGSERRALEDQPYPDAPSYAALAAHLAAGEGYQENITGEPATRYPPGLPLLLSPFAGLDLPTVAVGLTIALAVAAWWVAGRIGGGVAAGVAVLLLAASASLRHHASWVMADVPTALVTVLALGAVVSGRHRLAGLLVGFGVALRLAFLPAVLGLSRRAWLPCGVVLVALLASKLVWGWGYDGDQASWDVQHLWSTRGLSDVSEPAMPNALAYPAMLLGLKGQLVLPGAVVLAAVGVWRRPERRFVLAVAAGSMLTYLPYFAQAQRFMFPVLALVAVYAGVGCSDVVRWVRRRRESGAAARRRRGFGAAEARPKVSATAPL